MLPTHISTSNIGVANVYWSLAGFVAFYTVLLIIEMYLMIKYVKLGPGSLGTGRYYGETPRNVTPSAADQEVNHVV